MKLAIPMWRSPDSKASLSSVTAEEAAALSAAGGGAVGGASFFSVRHCRCMTGRLAHESAGASAKSSRSSSIGFCIGRIAR